MKGGLAAAMWATKVGARAGPRARAATSSSTSSATRRSSATARARSSTRAPAADVTLSLEPTELRLCAAEGGLVHFRIEVEGVEAHASTRYLSRPRGRQGRRRRQRDREDDQAHRRAAGARAAVGEHEVASDPAAGLRHALAGDHRRRPGRRQPTAGSTSSRTPARAELLLGRIQHVVLPGRVARGRAAPRSRRSSPPSAAPTRGCASTRRGSPGSSGSIYFPPLDVPLDHPAVRHARRLPRPRSGSTRRRRGSAPRPTSPGTASGSLPGIICGPGRLAQCHVADEYLETEQLALAAKVYAPDARRWCA